MSPRTPQFSSRQPASRLKSLVPAAVAGIGVLALSACSGGAGDATGDASADGSITVVTTTSVYADVVEQVAGDNVEVVPVIDSPAQDPHSYEATPQDRLTVEDADLVVLNGGGYDAFMEDLAEEAGAPVVNAVEVSGLEGSEEGHDHDHDHADEEHSHEGEDHATEEAGHSHDEEGHSHDHGSFNEHVWYDLDSVTKTADAVAEELGVLDGENSQTYQDNAEAFGGEVEGLHERVSGLGLEGDYVATEPVAGYLLEDAGLHDVTPTEFTVAVEDGTDAAPLVYDEVRTLVEDEQVQLLAYNEQTSTGQSQDLRTVAEQAGLPVVSFSENLPEDTGYLDWMSGNIDNLEQAMGGSDQ